MCECLYVCVCVHGWIHLRTNKRFKFSTKPPKNCIEKDMQEERDLRERGRGSEHRVYIIIKVKINKESTL